MSDDANVPTSSRFHRFHKLASLSARIGSDVISRGVRRITGAEAPNLLSMATAEKLVETLGDLKGAAMKMGQALSMDADLLPPELRAVLGRLQNEAPPMPYETVARVIEEELGQRPERAFDTFHTQPFAAASVGQVHRATVQGRAVAVKVQYPGMEDVLRADLDGISGLVKAISLTSKNLDLRAYVGEIREQVLLEADYRREARLAREFRSAVASFPDLVVPEVIETHSSGKVLTLEYLEGPTLRGFVESNPSNEDRLRVARLLSRAIYGPILVEGLAHADPHPGNFLILADGRLALLDFGSVRRFSPHFARVHRELFIQVLELDLSRLAQQFRALGFEVGVPDEDADALLLEVMTIATEPLRTTDYDFQTSQLARQMRQLAAAKVSTFLRVRPPPEGMLFGRAIGGLSQNLKLLGARGNYRQGYEELREVAIDLQKKVASTR